MKYCSYNKCKQKNPQSISEFCVNSNSKDGLNYNCKSCMREYITIWRNKNPEKSTISSASWRKMNPEKHKENSVFWRKMNPEKKKRNDLKKYNITLEQFNDMKKKQNYFCAICNKHESKCPKGLHIDHNHITGKIRGLLCRNCNLALGLFKDNAEIIEIAFKYLKDETFSL